MFLKLVKQNFSKTKCNVFIYMTINQYSEINSIDENIFCTSI